MTNSDGVRHYIEYQEHDPDRGDCKPLLALRPRPARYECLSCGRRWQGAAGPSVCEGCGSVRVRWVDF